MSNPNTSKPNAMILTGAVMFFLWGILHVYAGMLTVIPFWTDGPGANLALYGVIAEPGQLSDALRAASHVALNFGLDLAGYGVLAIWLSIYMWKGVHVSLSFWLMAVMLGISDGAFVYSLLLPGYVSLLEGVPGPILYVLGMAFTTYGLFGNSSKSENG